MKLEKCRIIAILYISKVLKVVSKWEIGVDTAEKGPMKFTRKKIHKKS